MTIRRLAVVVFASLGLCVPAAAAPLTLSTGSLTVDRTCVLNPLTAASPGGADTWVNQQNQNNNFGTSDPLTVTSRSGRNARALVRFDLSRCTPAIPGTATVTSATLRLVTTGDVASSCRTYGAHRVNSSWAETSVTWSTQPSHAGTPTSTVEVGASGCSVGGTGLATWTVTSDVVAFRSGTTNHGWAIRDQAESANGSGFTSTFYSRDFVGAPAAPQLRVSYR